MGEACVKIFLIVFNLICLMAGIAMFVGGMLLEYTQVGKSVLTTLSSSTVITSNQLGIIGVVLIALGALVILVSFIGCCGAVSGSRFMLGLYFVFLLLLLLGQIGIAVSAFVIGFEGFTNAIEAQLRLFVGSYGDVPSEAAVVDTIQQYFQCCGYNGTSDYLPVQPMTTNTTTMPTMNATWPDSCCVGTVNAYVNLQLCHNTTIPQQIQSNYVYTKGCTAQIATFVQNNLIVIGGVAVGIAILELIAMVTACCLRSELD